MNNVLNLGILAHVDAGKTSLTERLLHAGGVLTDVGSVDRGDTHTDSLELERRRGITIKSAVASFTIHDTTVNLIDTPGHPDFIAEVERVLTVLDGAVLVVSAVEGVQAQTRVLMRTLQRLGIPTLLFVNKIDRNGADLGMLLRNITRRLTPDIIAMESVDHPETSGAVCTPYGRADEAFAGRLLELLAGHDDDLLAAYVTDEPVPYDRLRRNLVARTRMLNAHPTYFGAAATGAGLPELLSGITEFLSPAQGDETAAAAGTVFKIDRGPAGEKIAYIRMFSGQVRTRQRITYGSTKTAKITGIAVFENGTSSQVESISAGQIGRIWGLSDVLIGDSIGTAAQPSKHRFAPPTLETTVVPCDQRDRRRIHSALAQLAEQDPLINFRQDDLRQEFTVSLYGEVQKEVIQSTLAEEFGVDVDFRATTTICIEQPGGSGEAVELIGAATNPFLATVGLRVEPGSGVEFRLGVELGSMPRAFVTAVEETVRATLAQGLHGWEVTDCAVTLTHSGYWARQSRAHGSFDKSMSSTAGDFKQLTPLILMDALRKAGTLVHEPVNRFRLEIPADVSEAVARTLARLEAVPHAPLLQDSLHVVEGDIRASRVNELERRLPGLTRGEGVLESAFDRYEPVTGEIPQRPRTDHNPLDRDEYISRVLRRS